MKVVVDEAALAEFIATNKPIRDLMVGVAQDVAAEAQATAQSAQEGPGGTIDGYAEAGFSVVYESRGLKRPRVNVVANADEKMALAAYFHTLKRDGVDHLRAALYKFTTRG
jgi:translation elongation factor EF-Ts